jgi:hypothetical protein
VCYGNTISGPVIIKVVSPHASLIGQTGHCRPAPVRVVLGLPPSALLAPPVTSGANDVAFNGFDTPMRPAAASDHEG